MREDTIDIIRRELKIQIPLFAFALLMCGLGIFVVQYFNLTINLPTNAEQLPNLDWESVHFSSGIIVFGAFTVIGFTPLIAYILNNNFFKGWRTSVSDMEEKKQ